MEPSLPGNGCIVDKPTRATVLPRRRWQFRLSALFLLMASISVGCWVYIRMNEESWCREAATAQLRDRGVFVTGQLYTVGLGGPAVTDRVLSDLAGLLTACGGPKNLELTDARITRQSLATITKMRRLERLCLSGTAIGDDGLAELAILPQLSNLRLDDTDVSDQGIVALIAMPRLRKVSLIRTQVTADGIAALRRDRPAVNVVWSGDD